MFSRALRWSAGPIGLTTGLYLYNRLKGLPIQLLAAEPTLTISAYRPNDKMHIYFAVQTYQEKETQVMPDNDWKLVDTYKVY